MLAHGRSFGDRRPEGSTAKRQSSRRVAWRAAVWPGQHVDQLEGHGRQQHNARRLEPRTAISTASSLASTRSAIARQAVEGDLAAALLYAGPGAMLSHAHRCVVVVPDDRRPTVDRHQHRRGDVSRSPGPSSTPVVTSLGPGTSASRHDGRADPARLSPPPPPPDRVRFALAEAEYLDCSTSPRSSSSRPWTTRQRQPAAPGARAPPARVSPSPAARSRAGFLALCETHEHPAPASQRHCRGLAGRRGLVRAAGGGRARWPKRPPHPRPARARPHSATSASARPASRSCATPGPAHDAGTVVARDLARR